MARSTGHSTKSKVEKDFYTRYIKEQDYEPTIDESLPFKTSNDKSEDFSLQKAERKRKEPRKDVILRHFEENWVKWLFSSIGAILVYFFFTFQMNLLRTDTRSIQNEKDILNLKTEMNDDADKIDARFDKLESEIEVEKGKNQNQDLQIQRNSILLENKNN